LDWHQFLALEVETWRRGPARRKSKAQVDGVSIERVAIQLRALGMCMCKRTEIGLVSEHHEGESGGVARGGVNQELI